jgi:hypothetical protein
LAAVFAAFEQQQQPQPALSPLQALFQAQQQPPLLPPPPPPQQQQPAVLLMQQLVAQLQPAQQAQGQPQLMRPAAAVAHTVQASDPAAQAVEAQPSVAGAFHPAQQSTDHSMHHTQALLALLARLAGQ